MRAHELVQVCVDTAEKDGSSGLEKLDIFVRELLEMRRSYDELRHPGPPHPTMRPADRHPLLLAGLYWGSRTYRERSPQQADETIRDFIVSSLQAA